jgi:hypothetical protein
LDHLTSVLHHTPLDAAQCSQIHFRQPVKCTAPRYFIVHYPLLPRKNSILLWCEIRVDTGLTTSEYPKYPKLKDILYHRLPHLPHACHQLTFKMRLILLKSQLVTVTYRYITYLLRYLLPYLRLVDSSSSGRDGRFIDLLRSTVLL